ncbi:hypothetical protein FDA33_01040 [Clostridium botulinum]|uniref:hypothetical protein n=1 Tax=Clostridium botulinum TaxID=1491 RepID=UPI0013F1274C|nr:hypothetical protein [Clostridium botulinum]MBN1051623.1 hypothetical protein [Clostridium botulinum]MCS6110725.1 hypothetical protein [Clostridium botulinum]NFE11255.1 hypothetical protein [Clostridium botulinum]NFH88816.1 hypothetical protein [Clostridium botulinum]NFI16770.1 hypothetical protein [Clostridium botulinum]
MLKEKLEKDDDYEVIALMLAEDYLEDLLQESEINGEVKKVIYKFIKDYMFNKEELYILEAIKDKHSYILIENDKDEIIDKLDMKKIEDNETWDDYSLLTMPQKVDDELRLYAILEEEEKIKLDAFKEMGKYLGLNKYICSAIDNNKEKNIVTLICDSDGNIIEKID